MYLLTNIIIYTVETFTAVIGTKIIFPDYQDVVSFIKTSGRFVLKCYFDPILSGIIIGLLAS